MNSKIIIAAIVIGGAGIVNHWLNNQPITSVVIGTYIFLFILAIMDIFGGPFSKLSSALAMLAVVYILIGVDPTTKQPLFPWQQIINLVQGKKA
jgi:hypothetical protein